MFKGAERFDKMDEKQFTEYFRTVSSSGDCGINLMQILVTFGKNKLTAKRAFIAYEAYVLGGINHVPARHSV